MTTRPTPTGPHKLRATAHIRRLAQDVKRTFPDMDVHEHLTDAAREIEAGRHDNAKHHLDAAINAFAPLHITRHGIHDDTGHMAAKSFMQRAHRGRLLAADVEHISGANQELAGNRREAAVTAAQEKAEKQQMVQVQSAGQAGVKAMSWEDIDMAIELSTFAGKPPGSGANFAKLKGSLAKRGAKNPGALAAYIGRKKYGAKKFGKMSHATPRAGGIELVGPKGYIHGWIHASMAHLEKSGGGAYMPDHPGFGVKTPSQMSPREHRRAAAGHLAAMKKAPAGSAKAQAHHRFAKLHAAASAGVRGAQKSGASYARAPRTGMFASETTGIELVGPKGYSHGWVFHGRPGAGGGPAPERRFLGGKQVSETEFRQSTNASNKAMGLKPQFPEAGFPAVREPTSITRPKRVAGWVTGEQAAKYHGQEIRGDTGNGVVVGTYNHHAKSVTDRKGKAHKVTAIDPTAHNTGFKGNVATSHLPFDARSSISAHDRAYRTGAVYRNIKKGMGGNVVGLSADTGRLATEPHPFGKPGGPGLWGVKGMELPPYVQNIARALLRTGRAKTLSQAIAMAKGATNRWVHGKNTSPEVRSASAGANSQWASKQVTAHAHANGGASWETLELTGTAAGAAKDPRIAAGAAGGGRFGSGGAAAAAGAQPKQQSRAQRKAALLATAKKDRARAKLLAIRIRADRAALASASGKITKGQKGAKTTSKRATTGSAAPAAKGAAAKKAAANPMSAANTGLSPQAVGKAMNAATAQAKHMSKAQLTAAIKTMTGQEKALLAAAVTATAQAAKL